MGQYTNGNVTLCGVDASWQDVHIPEVRTVYVSIAVEYSPEPGHQHGPLLEGIEGHGDTIEDALADAGARLDNTAGNWRPCKGCKRLVPPHRLIGGFCQFCAEDRLGSMAE
ncbi:MAG: hypothetical protein WC683_08110 [bacterium]